jgi:sugar lactone lactonase YvrE
MPTDRSADVVLEGLVFPEGPRWHDDRLVFSDMHDHRVVALDPLTGATATVCEVPEQPSGLGWQPDGTMLVVSMIDRRVLRLGAAGRLELHADLADLAPFHCNDMVVDAEGGAYVGNFGFDIFTHDIQPRPTTLVRVEPDGSASVAAAGLQFPNGMVITSDGRTLIVGESWGARLTAFDVAGDGTLSNRRVWAAPAGHVPDGICLDAAGAIWMACPASGDVVRVLEGGEITDVVHVSATAFACMLGGTDRTTLFVCVAHDANPDVVKAKRSATIEAVDVDVPGAGLP